MNIGYSCALLTSTAGLFTFDDCDQTTILHALESTWAMWRGWLHESVVSSPPAIYCADTSALIDLRRRYPPKVFGALWTEVERLINRGRLIAPREVLRELQRGDDEMYKWAKTHERMFVDLDEEQMALVREIQGAFPRWIDHEADAPIADPFVIALARRQTLLNAGDPRVVVSHENPGGPGATRIPNVCERYGIEHLQLVDLFIREGWSFGKVL
jgi:hypothetical protein